MKLASLLAAPLLFIMPLTATANDEGTLKSALLTAYQTNPELSAAQYALQAVDESYAQASAGFRPQINLEGTAGYIDEDNDNAFSGSQQERTPLTGALNISQTAYSGGRFTAQQNVALNDIFQARATLKNTEQQVLFDATTAYTGILQSWSLLKLNEQNESVLRKNLEATQDRFDVGEVTLTDVAQAESRLARATADTVRAKGDYTSARATYQRIIGVPPVGKFKRPDVLLTLPSSLDDAIAIAKDENPQLVAASFARESARSNIRLQKAFLLPQLTLDASLSKSEDVSVLGGGREALEATARLTIPLYQGGAVYSRVREAQQRSAQARQQLLNQERIAQEQVIRSWDRLSTATASIQSFIAEVRAAEIAQEGVRQEAAVGSRTVLDVLDAEQELLDSRVNLVLAEREKVLAQYALMASVGRLTILDLGIDASRYDPTSYFSEIKGQWFGFHTESEIQN